MPDGPKQLLSTATEKRCKQVDAIGDANRTLLSKIWERHCYHGRMSHKAFRNNTNNNAGVDNHPGIRSNCADKATKSPREIRYPKEKTPKLTRYFNKIITKIDTMLQLKIH